MKSEESQGIANFEVVNIKLKKVEICVVLSKNTLSTNISHLTIDIYL